MEQEKEMMQKENEGMVPQHPNFKRHARSVLRSHLSREEKQELLSGFHAKDLADMLLELLPGERQELYRLLDENVLSDAFTYLDDPAPYMRELGADRAADVLEQMDADDAAETLEALDEGQRRALLSRMESEAKEGINLIRSYAEDEIGSFMTTNCIRIPRGATVKQAMRSLKEQAGENDNISTLYIVEEDNVLYGAMGLQELLIARKGDDLEEMITTSYPYVFDREKLSDCLQEMKDYAEDSIPVLDSNHRMLGVVTAQALAEAVNEDLTEDYAQLAGLSGREDLHEGLAASLCKRLPWLMVLMVLGLLVSTVTELFDGIMARLSVLVAFQSLVLDMAGNVGTQSLGVSIRVLADEGVRKSDKLRLALKELRVGLVIGLLMGVLSGASVCLYICLTDGYPWLQGLTIGCCVGLAMLVAMVISSMTGTVIPIALKGAGIDPAVASGPLITTVNDLVAVVSYYGLAMLLLIRMLHMG